VQLVGAKDEFPPSTEDEKDLEPRTQRGMEVDPNRYYETGRAAVGRGPDGMPLMQGDPPPPPPSGLTVEGLVCNRAPGRDPCRYYGAVLTKAEGVARGFEQMHQIRRFCTRLATAAELFEIDQDMIACTLRDPPEERSRQVIDDFEDRQRDIADESAQKSAKLDL
jgi:hypothetical protein